MPTLWHNPLHEVHEAAGDFAGGCTQNAPLLGRFLSREHQTKLAFNVRDPLGVIWGHLEYHLSSFKLAQDFPYRPIGEFSL